MAQTKDNLEISEKPGFALEIKTINREWGGGGVFQTSLTHVVGLFMCLSDFFIIHSIPCVIFPSEGAHSLPLITL